jgi:hypothetical protein
MGQGRRRRFALILKKLAAYPKQNGLARALREIGRIESTLGALDWIGDPRLRRETTEELNKGEACNALARAVAFHRLGRFRDRSHESHVHRAAALKEEAAPEAEKEIRFTLVLLATMADQVDTARKKAGGMARLAWMRLAITEKLARE